MLGLGNSMGTKWSFDKTFTVKDTKRHCDYYGEFNPVHWDLPYVKKFTKFDEIIVPGMMIQNCFVHIPDQFLASVDIGMVPVLRDVNVSFVGTAFVDKPVHFEAEVVKERVGKISVVEFEITASQKDNKVANGRVKIMVTGSW